MDAKKLERLATEIANSLLGEGDTIELGNDYRVSYIKLYLKDDERHSAWGELFHANRHGDDREGKYPNATVEEAADACQKLLRKKRDWTAIGRKHGLSAVFITVIRMKSEAKRYLYGGSGGTDNPDAPDDPLIVF